MTEGFGSTMCKINERRCVTNTDVDSSGDHRYPVTIYTYSCGCKMYDCARVLADVAPCDKLKTNEMADEMKQRYLNSKRWMADYNDRTNQSKLPDYYAAKRQVDNFHKTYR